MSAMTDAIITYAILRKFTTPFTETNAYKHGIIDAHGNPTPKAKQASDEVRDNYTLLDRLVFKLKRIFEKMAPSLTWKLIGGYAAALAFIKESAEDDNDDYSVFEHLDSSKAEYWMNVVEGNIILGMEESKIVEYAENPRILSLVIEAYVKGKQDLIEDALAAPVGNTVAQVQGLATEPVITKKAQKKWVDQNASTGRKIEVINPVNEALEPHHEEIADSWQHFGALPDDTKDKIEKALGDRHGYGSVMIPVRQPDIEPDEDVQEHLSKHGWEIKHYRDGIATTTKQVGNEAKGIPVTTKTIEQKIGKVLSNTGASSDLIQKFANDPARRSKDRSTDDLRVFISTHPHAVAGMTSGTKWHDESCMDLDKGCNRHYLERDSRHGTHVAFLVHKDDKGAQSGINPTNPIARIALKRYVSGDDTDDIYRPELKTYGSSDSAFEHTVHSWAKENYPSIPGMKYNKVSSLYHDLGSRTYRSLDDKQIHTALENMEDVSDVDNITKKHVSDFVKTSKNISNYTISAMATNLHPSVLSSHSVNLLANRIDPEGGYGKQAFMNIMRSHGDKLSSDNLSRGIDVATKAPDGGRFSLAHVPEVALGNKNLPDHYADQLINEHPLNINRLHEDKIKPHHIEAVREYHRNDLSSISSASAKKYMTTDDLKTLYNRNSGRGNDTIRYSDLNKIMSHPEMTPELRYHIVDREIRTNNVGSVIKDYPLKDHHVDFITSEDNPSLTGKLIRNEHLTDSQIDYVKNHIVHNTTDYQADTLHDVSDRVGDKFTHDDFEKMIDRGLKDNERRIPFIMPVNMSNTYMDHLESRIQKHHFAMNELYDNHDDYEDQPEFNEHAKTMEHLLKVHGLMVSNHLDHHDNDLSDLSKQAGRVDFADRVGEESAHDGIRSMMGEGDTFHHEAKGQIKEVMRKLNYYEDDDNYR